MPAGTRRIEGSRQTLQPLHRCRQANPCLENPRSNRFVETREPRNCFAQAEFNPFNADRPAFAGAIWLTVHGPSLWTANARRLITETKSLRPITGRPIRFGHGLQESV